MMPARITFLIALLCSVVTADSDPPSGELYALLVAGSNGWWNYRHQADVAHAYHTLLAKGVKVDNIIVMMYDDIANHPENPYKGQLFNSPNGTDVCKGLKIDYRGDSVTPDNFIAVLSGDASAVVGGNGRVIRSTSKDRIFVYFTDHGSEGLVAFPDDILTVKRLNKALREMHKNHKYHQLVFYLEACESGSMFKKVLKSNINVYAVTAANEEESSWAVYCENDLGLPCLGDEFSVNWMDDSDSEDISAETLNHQFALVKKRTLQSHVMHYGNLSIGKEPVGWFQGAGNTNGTISETPTETQEEKVSWPSRDVELMHLQMKKLVSPQSAAVDTEISRIQKDRHNIEAVFTSLINHLVKDGSERRRLFEKRSDVENLDCHDDVVRIFDMICIDVNKYEYALKYVYVLNNLCTKFNDSAKIIEAMWTTCSKTHSKFS